MARTYQDDGNITACVFGPVRHPDKPALAEITRCNVLHATRLPTVKKSQKIGEVWEYVMYYLTAPGRYSRENGTCSSIGERRHETAYSMSGRRGYEVIHLRNEHC